MYRNTRYPRTFGLFLLGVVISIFSNYANPQFHNLADTTPTPTPALLENLFPPLQVYEFDKPTLAENGWGEVPGGFLGNPAGTISLVNFSGNQFSSSQDKKGVALTVNPSEVAFVYAKAPIRTGGAPVMLRMTVRADGAEAAVALAALKGNMITQELLDGSIATHIPASAASFQNTERRIVLMFEPDQGDQVTPVIQVAATGKNAPVTVFVDRLEFFKLDAGFFGASVAQTLTPTYTPSPTPTNTLTPTPTNTPNPNAITIKGIVKSLFGNTIKGASVTIGDYSVQSGIDGRFQIVLPSSGTYIIRALVEGYQDYVITLDLFGPQELNITLRPFPTPTPTPTATGTPTPTATPTPKPGSVYGQVYDAFTFDPIIGATVTIEGLFTMTDKNGFYKINNVPWGQQKIKTEAQGYWDINIYIYILGNVEVNIPMAKEVTIVIPLDLPADAKPLEMVLIPAGTFIMGSPVNEKGSVDEGPQHQVTLTKSFYMGKYEVTQAQYQAAMGSNPSYFKGNNLPVESVSWDDCQTFIQKLNQMSQGTFRLPTEAEWEYACRAGTTAQFYWGNDSNYSQINDYAWYNGNNSPNGTKEVGLKKPNAWGLYDMSGNVWEWCQDWYGSYSSDDQVDSIGPKSGSTRVLRGGLWYGSTWVCRSALRNDNSPDCQNNNKGFRLATTLSTLTDTPINTFTPVPPTPPQPPTPTWTPTSVSVPSSQTITVPLDLPAGAKPLEMVLIPSGTFTMGSPDNEDGRSSNEGPQHKVTITQPFYLGKYEVTQAQYQTVMGSNPSFFKGNNLPVDNVSFGDPWDDCQTFIQKLNQMRQGTFRLPTEAEWEYACRAGTTTRFYWGDDPNYSQIGQYAWYVSNSSSKTHEVGTKLPNAWGLFDMSGNVNEWCQDWYGGYSSNDQVDPIDQQSGSYRVLRGGGWSNGAWDCRSANRNNSFPDLKFYINAYIGFRLTRTY